MKGNEIAQVTQILSGMRLSSELFPIYLSLRKVLRGIEQDRDEAVKKFRDDWGGEIDVVEGIRKSGKPVEGHGDYLDAEKAGSDYIKALYDSDYPVEYERISMERFLAATKDANMTNGDAAVLADFLV